MGEKGGAEMGTEYEVQKRTLVIRVGGDLDHHVAEQIREQADRLIDQRGILHVIFDFSRSGFMDSSGIGVIMGRYRKVCYAGGRVSVTGVTGRMDKVFRMSGLERIVRRYDRLEDVIERG